MRLPAHADSADPRLLARPIGETPLAFVDVETTGFSPQLGDRVCEIAIVRRVGARVETQFTSLINPECSIGPRAASVNGITAHMVNQAPCFRDVAAEVSRLLDGAAFVAHNAGFDHGFIGAELARVGRALTTTATIDTLALARVHLDVPGHSLGVLAQVLGLASGQHRALGDVGATCGVFDHLVMRLGGWSTPLQAFVGHHTTPSPWGFRRRRRH